MSHLGNGGWPNSMTLGEDIDLDELLQKHRLFDFVSGCLQFSRGEGGPILGPKITKNHLSESQLSGHIKITKDSPRKSNGLMCFY